MKLILALIVIVIAVRTSAQDTISIEKKAAEYSRLGDYNNAVLILNRALESDPNNISIIKALAVTYYQISNYPRMQAVLKEVFERGNGDVEIYQLEGLMSRAIMDLKEADKVYKKGLKKFPESGALLCEYGEMLKIANDNSAINMWEKGIEVDPNYPGNYYNAARYYSTTKDKVWVLLYGEIFVNLESYSNRTMEIKVLLNEAYKKLFIGTDMEKYQDIKNPFVKAYLGVMENLVPFANSGITVESLLTIRTQFLKDWMKKYHLAYPYRLFEVQQQFIDEGIYTAYNQWLFGFAQNKNSFENWVKSHSNEYKQFTNAQANRIFKVKPGQNYRTKSKSGLFNN